MNSLQSAILLQASYYGVVFVLALLMVGVLQRGFFWKYVRVRLSFGKFVLCKIRSINRDHYAVGYIEGKFLIYGKKKKEKRIVIKDRSVFYRTVGGTTWVDVDDDKSALCKTDYEPVTGFDAVKYNNLYLRALYKPQIIENKEKVIIGLLVLVLIGVVGLAYMFYKNGVSIDQLKIVVSSLKGAVEGLTPVIGNI